MRVIFMVLAFGFGTSAAVAEVTSTPMAKPHLGVLTADEALIAKKIEDDRAMADCQRHWDRGTHMTRHAWSQTCRRVQERFRQLDIR
jgi:hypothetical protein